MGLPRLSPSQHSSSEIAVSACAPPGDRSSSWETVPSQRPRARVCAGCSALDLFWYRNRKAVQNRLMDSEAPLYQRLAGQIELGIASGALRAGDRLPSVRQLTQQHGVSMSTALQALRHLE